MGFGGKFLKDIVKRLKLPLLNKSLHGIQLLQEESKTRIFSSDVVENAVEFFAIPCVESNTFEE